MDVERMPNEKVPIIVEQINGAFERTKNEHRLSEIAYITRGKGFYYSQGHVIPVEKGDLFFIPSGESHAFRPATALQKKTFTIFRCLFQQADIVRQLASMPQETIDRQPLPDFFKRYAESAHTYREQFNEFQQLFKPLFREYSQQHPGYRSLLLSLVMQLVIMLMRNESEAGEKERISKEQRVKRMLHYMENHGTKALRLGDIAHKEGISERECDQLIKAWTGKTFQEYLQQIRIEKSCQLLITTDKNIKEIAGEVGYGDFKDFQTLFRKITDTTPQQFRSQHQVHKFML